MWTSSPYPSLFPHLDSKPPVIGSGRPRRGQGTLARLRALFASEPEFCAFLASEPWRLEDILGAGYGAVRTEVAVLDDRLADLVLRLKRADRRQVAVVEAQFGRSDDDHLGRLHDCYAPGVGAGLAVLLAEDCRPEHTVLAAAFCDDTPTMFVTAEAALWYLGADRWTLNLSRCKLPSMLFTPSELRPVLGDPKPRPRQRRPSPGPPLPFELPQ